MQVTYADVLLLVSRGRAITSSSCFPRVCGTFFFSFLLPKLFFSLSKNKQRTGTNLTSKHYSTFPSQRANLAIAFEWCANFSPTTEFSSR